MGSDFLFVNGYDAAAREKQVIASASLSVFKPSGPRRPIVFDKSVEKTEKKKRSKKNG